jgi:hypothetical protein
VASSLVCTCGDELSELKAAVVLCTGTSTK